MREASKQPSPPGRESTNLRDIFSENTLRSEPPLLCCLTAQDGLYGLEHDEQIESQRHVLDVVEIEFELFSSLFERRSISVSNLRPSGKSWPNHMPQFEVWNLLNEPRNKFRPFRTRADKPHITAQHVPQLRHLIEPRLAHKFADARHPRIVLGRPLGAGDFCVSPHRTKLVNCEVFSTQSNARLREEDRPWRRQAYQQDDKREKGQKQQQNNRRSQR